MKRSPEPAQQAEVLTKEVRELLDRLDREKTTLRRLLSSAEVANDQYQEQEERMEALMRRSDALAVRMDELERQAEASRRIAGEIDRLQSEVASVERTGEGLRTRMHEFDQALHAIGEELNAFEPVAAAAIRLREDLNQSVGQMQGLEHQLGSLRKRLEDQDVLTHEIRRDQQALKKATDQALATTAAAGQHLVQVTEGIDEASVRLTGLSSSLGKVEGIQHVVVRVEKDLLRLNAFGDHVQQKVATFEQQREALERSMARVEQLSSWASEMDSLVKTVGADVRFVKKAQRGIANVQELYGTLLEQQREVEAVRKAERQEGKDLSKRLSRLKKEIDAGLKRLALENRAIGSFQEEVAALRAAVNDSNRRMQAVERTGRAVMDALPKANKLENRLSALSAEVDRIDEVASRIGMLSSALDRLQGSEDELAARLQTLEGALPQVREVVWEMSQVRKGREEIRDVVESLEDVRMENEKSLAHFREVDQLTQHVGAQLSWLRDQVAEIDALRTTVEAAKRTAEQAVTASHDLEQRRELIQHIEQRITSLSGLGRELTDSIHTLEERRAQLIDIGNRAELLDRRLNDADIRVAAVSAKTEVLEEVGIRVGNLEVTVAGTEKRIDDLHQRVDGVYALEHNIARVDELVTDLSDRLGRTQAGVDKGLAALAEATELRDQLLSAMENLHLESQTVAGQLGKIEVRARQVAALADDLDSRAGAIQFAHRRMQQIEEKCIHIESAEERVNQVLIGIEERKNVVEAVRANLDTIFETVGSTLGEVKTIIGMQQDLRETGERVNEILKRSQDLEALAASLDERTDRLEAAERQASRLDALMTDIRSNFETLRGQKVVLDHAMDKAAQLSQQLRESDAALRVLREERELATQVVEDMKEQRIQDRATIVRPA